MHLISIIIGALVGAWLGEASEEMLGLFAGILIGSLLYRLAAAKSRADDLEQRINNLEQAKTSAIPPKADTTESWLAEKAAADAVVSNQEVPNPPVESPPITAAATAAPKSAAATFTPPPVVHERVPEAPPEPGPFSHTLEVLKRWLTTGNVPVKVGVIISFFGVAFLLKYAVDNSAIEIPMGVRYLAVAAFAAAMLGIGWRMRVKNPVYALSLQGGGIGVLFLTIYAAYRLHDLLPPAVALSLLVALTVAAGFLAVLQDSRALAILATTGGFLAPILVSSGSGNYIGLFSYYLVLNCAVLGIAWYRAWRELNIIGFVFTFGVGSLWGSENYRPEFFSTTEPFLIAYFLFYTAIAVLFAFRQRPALRGYVDGTLVFGTPTIAFALQAVMLQNDKIALSTSAAVVAVFYALLVIWLRRSQNENFELLTKSFIALSVAFATIAIPLAVDDRWTAIAWALEGAALVWIGVQQQSLLARLTGSILAFASGVIFVQHGWDSGIGIAMLNGNYLGGMLIALSSLYSARLLKDDASPQPLLGFVSVALMLWGVLWWLGVGYAELTDRGNYRNTLHLNFLHTVLSFVIFGFFAERFSWRALQRTTYAFLPLLGLFFVAYLLEHNHLTRGLGAAIWPLAIIAQVAVMYFMHENRSRTHSIWHAAGAIFLTAAVAHEIHWYIERVSVSQAWAAFAALGVVLIFVVGLVLGKRRLEWPVEAYFKAYFAASVLMTAAVLFWALGAAIDNPGDPFPMAYIPLLNPYDLLAIAGIATAWKLLALREGGIVDFGTARLPEVRMVLGAFAFMLASLAVIRAVHHFTDVPWVGHELLSSVVVQTALTIFWSALGVAGMLLGTRRNHRRLWVIGASLMIIVVLKLGLIDFNNTETVSGIASFLGVGLMLLVVGYFSPIPPKRDVDTEGSSS